MIPLPSRLENREMPYSDVSRILEPSGFALGGSWDYDHGSLDRYLDDAHTVWLRIPFQVVRGRFDGENGGNGADVRLGRPFVLKHLYNEGLDLQADVMIYKALVDQFQAPVDKDAELEERWVQAAREVLQRVEASFASDDGA